MKLRKPKLSNLVFLAVIIILIIPQTRLPIQVLLHKGLALFSPSPIIEEERKELTDYTWTLKKLDGSTYDFSKASGKVIVLNFWATWCAPCIAEMPSFQDLYVDYAQEIEFLMVSVEKETVIQKFLDKHDYTFQVMRPMSDIPNLLEARSIPRTFIIDKRGFVVVDKIGAANWNSEKVRLTLDQLLAE